MFVFPNFTFIEKHSHQKIGRTMWLTYSCDGDAVKDETLFEDRRRGMNTDFLLTGSMKVPNLQESGQRLR